MVALFPTHLRPRTELRKPKKESGNDPLGKLADRRREEPILPVIFQDAGVLADETVHLHLEQRMAQRLLARFRSQSFVNHDLFRDCLIRATDSMDAPTDPAIRSDFPLFWKYVTISAVDSETEGRNE